MGISADQVDRQREFKDAKALNFPLLSDPDRTIARAYGVARGGIWPDRRRTFVIDTDRQVMKTVRSELNMRIHADGALQALRDATSA